MQDRVVIMTEGGTGIGRAAALQFAQAGASIVVVGRRATPLEDVASVSDRLVPIVADIQHEPDIRDIVHSATKRWGRKVLRIPLSTFPAPSDTKPHQ
jgi:NAD(P)-dependent dehydrogenase (short-subunit alcohol dehydrogenase family)